MRNETPFLLLYDGDCRICTAFARAVTHVAPGNAVRARPIQASRALLAGMSEAEALGSAHLVAPDGSLRHGPDVLPALLGTVLARPSLEARVNASAHGRAATERIYAVLVSLRGNLNCVIGVSASAAHSLR